METFISNLICILKISNGNDDLIATAKYSLLKKT